MAYEVTKMVRGRPYRYRVRSERDPATGKVRNRWTYLGRGDRAGEPATVRVRRNARTALLDALARLLAGGDLDAVTAGAVSREAGLAHGTFYRYFRNKQDAFVALLDRIRSENPDRDLLDAPAADAATARRNLRDWASSGLRTPAKFGPVYATLYHLLSTRDAELLAYRRDKRRQLVERLTAFLAPLCERGDVDLPDPVATAGAITALLEGTFREAILFEPLDDARIAATVDAIERTVFARLA